MSGLPKKFIYGISALILALFCRLSLYSAEIHPALAKKMRFFGSKEFIPVILRLSDENPKEKIFGSRKKCISAAMDLSRRKSSELACLLNGLAESGHIRNKRDFWICSGLFMEADKTALEALAANGKINRITPNFNLNLPEIYGSVQNYDIETCNWGLEKIDVGRVWNNLVLTGEGVVIGHLDTGINSAHPDLEGKLIKWAEFDSGGNIIPGSIASDSGTHGTHTAGILVGGSPGVKSIGVAPGSKLISAKVIDGSSGSFAQMIAGIEWVIDPDGNPETDDGADVVNISLGVNGLNEEFFEPVMNMISAGIIPVCAAGNSGVNTSNSPANMPGAVAVGAVDAGDSVCAFSAGEVMSWERELSGEVYIKPDFTAPGYDIASTCSDGGYVSLSGTSMAAPFVTGTIALLLQKRPELTVSQIKNILKYASNDLGGEGKDIRYGWGRIDAYKACLCAVNQMYLNLNYDDWESAGWVYLTTPVSGESVWGDAVSLVAVVSPFISNVRFEYSRDREKWELIRDCGSGSSACYWDTRIVAQGDYCIRAVCTGRDGTVHYSGENFITVKDQDPVIVENGSGAVSPRVFHMKQKKVFPDSECIAATAEGTAVVIPRNLFSDKKTVEITNLQINELNGRIPPPESTLCSIGIFREIRFSDGTDIFPGDVTIVLPYEDENDDGIVDGTNINAADLSIYYLEEGSSEKVKWVKVESMIKNDFLSPKISSLCRKSVSARVGHFTLFGVFSNAPKINLDGAVVYPNPATSASFVKFDGLSFNCDIRIYDLLGHMIKKIDNITDGIYQWNLNDESGNGISNGIYFYMITDDSGGKAKGKFAVAR